MKTLTLLLLPLLLFTACSKAQEEPEPPVSLVREVPAASLTDAIKLKEEARLKCQDSAHCPANVGLFLATKPDGILSCTAFLVEEDVVATNSHCFPNAVKEFKDLCAERVSVIFAATGSQPEEKFACAELLGASERPNALSPDLALFRLAKKTGRAPFRLDRGGVAPEAIYEALKVNPAPGASGLLVHASCKAVSRTYRFSPYARASDPIFTVGDCQSVPGNSGSPLLNAAGAAVGILQTDMTVSSEQMKKVWGAHLTPGESFAPLALGTSLRCLNATDRWSFSPTCPATDDQAIPKPRIAELLPQTDPAAAAILAPFLARLPEGLEFDRTVALDQALVREETLAPVCFNAPGPWLDNFAVLSEPGRYLEEATVEANLPTLQARVVFNRYLQVSAAYSLKESSRALITFSPANLLLSGISPVHYGKKAKDLSFCADPNR